MAPSDRPDDADEPDSSDRPYAVTIPAVPGRDDRALESGSSPSRLPTKTDDAGQRALGIADSTDTVDAPDPTLDLPQFVKPPEVPGADPGAEVEPRQRRPKSTDHAERAPKPLVSGDPLLTGSPANRKAPDQTGASPRPQDTGPARFGTAGPPEPPPPPPPRQAQSSLSQSLSSGNGPTSPPPSRPVPSIGNGRTDAVGVTGMASDARSRPARRASRGAQLSGQQTSTPITRPADQSGPVPTLRPTTVAPVPRLAGRRPRVRRVTRVVRHVDPWSVFKVASVFSLVAYAICLVAGVLLWNVAYSTGTIDNVERGMESTGWEVFELEGGEIFHNAWVGGLFVAVGLTGVAVLVATLFNLITDLVGGIRFTVLEEEVVEKTASPMRRFATRRDDGAAVGAAKPRPPAN